MAGKAGNEITKLHPNLWIAEKQAEYATRVLYNIDKVAMLLRDKIEDPHKLWEMSTAATRDAVRFQYESLTDDIREGRMYLTIVTMAAHLTSPHGDICDTELVCGLGSTVACPTCKAVMMIDTDNGTSIKIKYFDTTNLKIDNFHTKADGMETISDDR